MFHQKYFSIRIFAYNTKETYLFDTSCYFVINTNDLFSTIVVICKNISQ